MSYKSDLGANVISNPWFNRGRILIHQKGSRWQETQITEKGDVVRSYSNIPENRDYQTQGQNEPYIARTG